MAGPFQTPQNERSFSGLIDQVLLDTGRPASLLSAIQYANATIRECHALGLFHSDLLESYRPVIDASPFVFTKPTVDTRKFRKIRTMQFASSLIYPQLKLPGRQLADFDEYYYAADDYFVVVGGIIGEYLNTAIYFWPKSFIYYPRLGATNVPNYPGTNYTYRPAYHDTELDSWMYLLADQSGYASTISDPTVEATRRLNATNWLQTEWYELVQEGTKNKIFNLFGDPRASSTFSLYKSMQKDLVTSVMFESEGF